MILKNYIKKNSYYDSATLMMLTGKLGDKLGSTKYIAVMMGTDMNKDIMEAAGLLGEEGRAAVPNDLVIAILAESEDKADEILADAETELNKKAEPLSGEEADDTAKTLDAAITSRPEANIAVVSLPGLYAAREVKKLLKNDKHVLLFSDNVSLEEEIELKDMALERDLLMMGPDCGTAVIGGVGLGFSNALNRGNIGIVAASGTGLQEVMCLISNRGGGVSEAIGTGGRDVKEAVGGRMLLQGLKILKEDPGTDVIVIVSKPPADSVVEKCRTFLKDCDKKVIACFIGKDSGAPSDPWSIAPTLEEAARMAVEASGRGDAVVYTDGGKSEQQVDAASELLQCDQKYIRGLYCGGTLCYETMLLLKKEYGKVYSNIALTEEERIKGKAPSREHTVLDLGDDEFTVGKPHPMIEPALRKDRLMEEIADRQTRVILADCELGYGSHPDPAGVLGAEIAEAKTALRKEGRDVLFIVNICGAYGDFQGYDEQKKKLEEAGAVVTGSNAQAVRLAVRALGGEKR